MLRIGITVILFTSLYNPATTQSSNPLKDPSICGFASCELDNEKFRYSQNVIYKYAYESSFRTLFEGTDNNDPQSDLYISAIAEVIFPTKCQGLLRLTKVQLKNQHSDGFEELAKPEPADYEYEDENKQQEEFDDDKPRTENIVHPRSEYFSKEIQEMDLKFDYRDGLIQEICPKSDESVWVTNFKRGILSAFQNTMFRFDLDHKTVETDVSGKCEVSYKFVRSADTSIFIMKEKDISTCQNRAKFKSAVQTTPYDFRKSDISWWPIYNSTSVCSFYIDNYAIKEVECKENVILIPFSNGENGAVSKTTMRLKFLSNETNEESSSDDGMIETRKSMLYDHSFSPKPTHNEIKISREYLKQMCSLGFPNIQRDFPDKFVKFLEASKQLSSKGLQQLLARSAGICPNGRKHIIESLPFIGSVASVEIMKDLITGAIKSTELSPEVEEVWMNSIFYLPRPEESTITTMFSLMQHYEVNHNPIYILIPSAVVHTFCKFNECKNFAIVMNSVKYLERIVTQRLNGDVSNKKTYESLMVALKGLGNIGIVSKKFESDLKDLIINEYQKNDVKLQAIEVFRKTNCDKTREFFVDIYQNTSQSVEIRIASYLQFMKCPNYLNIKQLKAFLINEPVNQVGSFVWSHLTNLAKTSSPQKVEMQGLLADLKLDEKFNMDFRKFSKNYEYSLFFDEYNFGLSGESNVIFGTESYLPRSVSFNGTINLFGNSVNPLEFNIRIQGMEKYIESIFGIDGPLNFDRLIDKFGFIIEKFKSLFSFDYEIIETILRSRRSSRDTNLITGKFPYTQNYDFKNPTGYFEHKIFGNDISFHPFDGFNELSDLIKKLIPVDRIQNVFSKKEELFIKSGTLVDVAYTIPTTSGFPLVLNGFGAYSLDMSYFGDLKSKNFWETTALDFVGRIKPSLSMEMNTKMQIDLFHASTDIKVKSNIYSNYAVETDIKLKGNSLASINLKLPQDRNDIFSIRSQLTSSIEGRETSLYGITNRYMNSTCTWPSIDTMLGLKVCIDYSLPDVSDTEKVYPSLVLSGPVVFDIHLDKADLSAKVFNFEYKWDKGLESSNGSITFETPHTKIPRQFTAILLTTRQEYNLSMGFVNGDQKQTALGYIKMSPAEKLAELTLNLNSNQYFSLQMSLLKKLISKTRSSMTPMFLLVINDQRVAGMNGIIKTIDKNNVTQHDIDLTFETKKMKSSAGGHVVLTGTSVRSEMTYTYKFSGKKEETIEINTELADKSQKMRDRTEYSGSIKFLSSAYKHYNFVSNSAFIRSLGHIETKIDINNAPDLVDPTFTLSTKVTFAKNTEEDNKSRTMFSIEMNRPQSNIDVKFHVKYDKNFKDGTEHNVLVLIRYSTKKEIISTTSVLFPQGPFMVDASSTLSIPDMNSCSVVVKIKELTRKKYYIDVNGKWFTGENIKFVGVYQDRTSNVKRYYKLKSVVSSKLFDDISLNLKYSRDLHEMKIKVQTEYKKKNYLLVVESSEIDEFESLFTTNLKWADLSYSLSANSSTKGIGTTKVELHLDRIRDVHLDIWGTSQRFSKVFGIEFKWDANRDPSQKFIISYEFDKPHELIYTGNVLVSYPERTLNGNLNISTVGPYTGNMKLSWSADEAIDMEYSVGSDLDSYRKVWAMMRIDTPFKGWRNNMLNGTLYQKDNLLSVSLASNWAENQNIGIGFDVDYYLGGNQLSGELKAEIQSTMSEVPIIKILLKHNQSSEKVDSEVLFRHKNFIQDEYRVFSLKSSWRNSIDAKHKNVSGSIKFISPFENYKTGAMVTKFSASKDRQIYGVFDVDVDDRVHTFTIEGYLKRLLDNMIVFNLTTPIDTFPYLFGKFGIQESKRYLIADLRTINKSLGIELLSNFVSISDFDLKFYVATPQPAFEKVLAIGKIKDDTIHLEGAWNKITLGFIGVWRFLQSNNFEYSYIALTPITHFEENGLVFKFIAEDVENFDIETSFKLGKHKLGMKAMGEPRTQLINQLGLQKASYIRENLFLDESDTDLDTAKSDIDFKQFYGVIGNFEVCTIFLSPISGNYEVQQVEQTYHALIKMFVPGGSVQVRNKLVAEPNNYVNRLVIDLPTKNLKLITSNVIFKIPDESGLIVRFDVGIVDNVRLNTYGVHLHYDLPSHPDLKIHDIALVVLFPLKNSTKVNIKSRLELTSNFVHLGSISLDGFETQLEISGKANQNQKDLDLYFNLMLRSPVVEYFQFESYLKKWSLQNDNKVMAGFAFNDVDDESKFDLDLSWRENRNHIIDGDFGISSNIFQIQRFNTSVFITDGQDPKFKMQFLYGKAFEQLEELKFSITKMDSKFTGEVVTPFKEYSNIRFDGLITKLETPGSFKTKGKLFKNLAAHDFEGEVTLFKNLPTQASLNFKNSDSVDTTLDYSLKFDDMKRSIKAVITMERDFLSFESELYIASLLDWAYNVKVKSSMEDMNELMLSTTLTPLSKTQFESSFEMITPWPSHHIDKVNVSTILRTAGSDGDFKLIYEISKFGGSGGCSWKWLQKVLKQEYQVKVFTTKKDSSTLFSTEIGFSNSTRTPANVKFDVNVNSMWLLGSKATFDVRNVKDMSFGYELSIPEPIKNKHKFEGHYKASAFPPKFENGATADIHLGYVNEDAVSSIKATGSIKSLKDITNSVVLEWGQKSDTKSVNSSFKMQEIDAKVNCDWELRTPYYSDENTVNFNANYQVQDIFKIFHATVSSPASRTVTVGDVAFADLTNMKGFINCTLPVFNVSWFDVNFDLDSQDGVTGKFIRASWPENYALLDSKSSFIQQKQQKEWKGTFKTELPLHTKHNIQIIYGLEEKPLITTGDASIEYNAKNIVNSHYTCKTENINEKEAKDVINLILENEVRPLGIHYTYHKKLDKPKKHDFAKRHLEVFDLGKENRFNITGEFTIETLGDTQNYELTAIHPNRTIIWTSQFSSVDKTTFHSSKIDIAKNVWLSYNVEVSNHTTSSDAESQELKLKVSYPDRELSVDGSYLLKSDSLDTDVKGKWLKTKRAEESGSDEITEAPEIEEKTVAAKFQWLDLELSTAGKDHQSVILSLKHPSFDKDVIMTGSYYRDGFNVTSLEVDFDYTEDEDHHAKFKSEIKNMTAEVGFKNYTISLLASHPASELNLVFDGSMGLQPKNYKIEAAASYKRGYLPEMELQLLGFIDTETKEVKFFRSTPNKLIDIYGTTQANFPRYTIDGIFVDTPEFESTGAFELDFFKKFINADVNFTEDASQNLQVKGGIPDTRSASFKIWRNYDDIQINDIVYFVQMNHSRLITSKLIWRPKMRKEVKETIKDFVTGRYNALIEELDYWVKTFYAEVYDTVKGILSESQPYAQEFLNDLAAVKDVDEDLVAFRSFLNESYNADDFYIQSFINYTMTVLDELAITDHIQTIPKIFKEMWEVLGESSMAFKNSTTWILSTIKTSYKESVEMFNNFMQGNSLEHITKFLEIIIEKYDRFVKDLHVTFMNYIETMWDNLTRAIAVYWNRVLQNIEPQIIRSIHFLESILWGISTEIFDFMYNRTNELIESPYFSKVSNITHDLDVFYQDLSHNDLFTNVRKYSGVMWQFLKEKFLSMVPFGKELREITADIANEFRELKKVEAVKEAVERYEEIESKINWLLSEFQFGKRLNALLDIIKNKLSRITQNALQTEDVYREAKTKFIFDPEKGKIEWEQKLPMAWHAFNETPQFEEISEYKMLKDVQSFLFSKRNNSMWSLYYGWTTPLTEPQNFLPPFKSHALLIGSSHVITFDKNFVTFDKDNFTPSSTRVLDEGCSYLLAHDFIDNRFSFILKSSLAADQKQKFLAKTLVIQSSDNVIEIELGTTKGSIKVGQNTTVMLPVVVDDLLVTQELNVITVSSRRGFKVRCNLEFDVCVIELSGWFFGKVAGVFGTMNNEPFDDFGKADNSLASDNDEFTESWKLDSMCSSEIKESPTSADKLGDDFLKTCESFFKQKNSYFADCFAIVDPDPFYKMCLSLAAHPKFQLTSETSEKAACTSGMAYMETCSIQNVPLRIPDNCVHCKLPNGNTITEGTYTNLTDNLIIPAVDVVFIMEIGACNTDAYKKNLLNALVTSIGTEFRHVSIEHHRFAVVTYGGSEPFSKPTSVTSNGNVFTNAQNVNSHFSHLRNETGNIDVFTAIASATKLIFKPGSVKIFVLSVCTKCKSNLFEFDSKSILQLLQDNEIVLHVLNDNMFSVRKVIGVDDTKAYIRKDQSKLIGSDELKSELSPIKQLGQCGSLAFDSKGSVFSSVNTNKKNDNDFKIVANVFAKRIAQNAKPKPCYSCECQGHNSGAAYMTCKSCGSQGLISSDYNIDGILKTDEDSYEDDS